MQTLQTLRNLGRLALLPCCLALLAWPALGADVYLVAKADRATMSDGTDVAIWGFATDLDGDLATDGGELPTLPGPQIRVDATDSVLTIHLRNDLPEPVSIIIRGQTAILSPVMVVDGQGRERVTSFTHEAVPNGGTATYTWPDLRPGTYLYQSGSHPGLQVQMGLYGGMKKDAAAKQAYDDPGTTYNHELMLVYSEIDPAVHHAVDVGTYGTPAFPSARHQRPRYFLINGKSYVAGQPPVVAGKTKQTTLIRFLNAGLETHMPVLLNQYMTSIAEDGQPYRNAKNLFSLELPAGKTKDVLVRPRGAGSFPLYDRALRLTSGQAPGGGMLMHLRFGSSLRVDLK